MGLAGAARKLSLISELKLLESLDKMMISLRFILQSKVNKWSEIADGLRFLRCLFLSFKILICSAPLTKTWCNKKKISLHDFPFQVIRNQKMIAKCYQKNFTKLQIKSHFSNLYLKLSNIFILKMRFLKNSALESFII